MAEEIHPLSYYQSLSAEELRLEIDRETELLAGFRDQLVEALQRRDEIREAMEKEATITELEELRRDREARIRELTREITELENKIRVERSRIRGTRDRVRTLERELPVTATRSNYFRLMRRIRDFREALRRYPPPSPVTRAYYHERIREHLRWMRAIRELLSLYGRLGGYYSAISRWSDTITTLRRRIGQYRRWQRVRVETTERLTLLRVELITWSGEVTSLRAKITILEAELEKKKIALPPVPLFRIKIRLYAVKRRRDYYLTFQGFFDIDAILDPETDLPIWDWPLTQLEIRNAKYHFQNYWWTRKDFTPVFSQDDIEQAYLTDERGISIREHLGLRPEVKHTKRDRITHVSTVPEEYLRLIRTLTLREIVIGMSNIQPRPISEPEGVFAEYFMIIDETGNIKWMDNRNRFIWKPTQDMIDRVKEELGLE